MSFGTWLHTKLHGIKVGEDATGNVYYRSTRKRFAGREERWVVYNGESEASKVPPEWHAWLHHTTDAPIDAPTRPWEKPHQPNMTGTDKAYLPPGHDRRGGEPPRMAQAYVPWTPES
jgi:NADH:ubiquinone oxidoreductase subunit